MPHRVALRGGSRVGAFRDAFCLFSNLNDNILCPTLPLPLDFVQSQAYNMRTLNISFHQLESDTQNAVFLTWPHYREFQACTTVGGVLLRLFLQNLGSLKHAQIAECSQRDSHLLLPNTFYFKAFPLWETISFFALIMPSNFVQRNESWSWPGWKLSQLSEGLTWGSHTERFLP